VGVGGDYTVADLEKKKNVRGETRRSESASHLVFSSATGEAFTDLGSIHERVNRGGSESR